MVRERALFIVTGFLTVHRFALATLRIGLLLFMALKCLPASAENPVPSAFPIDRYAPLRASSPFALATFVAPAPAPQASFAANWFVSGIARIGEDNFVTISSRDLSRQFSLFAGESKDGVTLASVNWSDDVGKSTVTLRRGAETAQLEFNEAQVHGPAAPTPAGPARVAGVAPVAPVVAALPPIPNVPNVRTHRGEGNAATNPVSGGLASGGGSLRRSPVIAPRQ
jgi:hypothetical protein